MHTVWKGALTFGLVWVPVKMHSATEEKDISMKQIHRDCGSNVSQVKKCYSCNMEVEADHIVKGFEYDKNKYVTFEKEDFEQLLPESNKAIKILDFVKLEEIDPIHFQKTYYLSPDDNAGRAYVLLMQALKTTSKVGISKFTFRSKSSLAVIRVIGNCLVLDTLFYHDEIRPIQQVPNIPEEPSLDKKELLMAQTLIKNLTIPFESRLYQDDYRIQLNDIIRKKILGEQIKSPKIQQQPARVMDLMSELQASIDALNKEKSVEAKKSAEKVKRKKEETA